MRPRKGLHHSIRLETIALDAAASYHLRAWHFPSFAFNWHYHPEVELALIIKGRGVRFVGDSIQDFEDGDLCAIGPNTPHTWHSEPLPRQPVRSMVVQFVPEFLGSDFLNRPETRRLRDFLTRARRGLRVTGRTREFAAREMQRMLGERLGAWSQFCRLLTILGKLAESRECRPLAIADFSPTLNEQANQRINAVFTFIRQRLPEAPTQQAAARLVRLSPQAFSRFFRRCVGKTYVEYVNELRVGMASRALLESDRSITEVAFASGFNTLSNFNRHFRRFKETSPRNYRRMARLT